MVGQEHITKTIKNQIMANRVGHAYLFSGSRGTGKTSAAKILARAVNCLDLQEGEPCNKCEMCMEALNGSLTDIVEMDAASNNSVEDVRDIRETVNFLPAKAKYRVYIIDEVHMLSTGAFNALLKTLEEPPAHVKFILATTEPQKLPATILSRCQRFDFKRISVEDIIKRLEIICSNAKIEITKEALKLIAVLSEGAMRDAISILERCVQDTEAKVTEDKVRELVGIPKLVNINKLTKSILEYDVNGAVSITDELIQEGQDLSNLLWEITKYVKDILVYKVGVGVPDDPNPTHSGTHTHSSQKNLEIYNKEELTNIAELAELAANERLLSIVYELSELENRIKWSNQRQIIFQTGVMKLCNKALSGDISELVERINKVETQLNNTDIPVIKKEENKKSIVKSEEVITVNKEEKTVPINKEETVGASIARPSTKIDNEENVGVGFHAHPNTEKIEEAVGASIARPSTKEAEEKATKTEVKQEDNKKVEKWRDILNKLRDTGKVVLYTNLINTNAIEINDMIIGIEFKNGLTSFGRTIVESPGNIKELERLVSLEYGKEMRIKLLDKDNNKKSTDKINAESLISELDLQVNIIEE